MYICVCVTSIIILSKVKYQSFICIDPDWAYLNMIKRCISLGSNSGKSDLVDLWGSVICALIFS